VSHPRQRFYLSPNPCGGWLAFAGSGGGWPAPVGVLLLACAADLHVWAAAGTEVLGFICGKIPEHAELDEIWKIRNIRTGIHYKFEWNLSKFEQI